MKILSNLALVVSILFSATASAESAEWFLMSRHGECVNIQVLERKVPNLYGIISPETFIKFMQDKGYDVEVKMEPALNGNAVQVKVPKIDIAVMFVKENMCKRLNQK